MADITMYGADWCGDCRRSKRLLDAAGVDYEYVDLVVTPDAAEKAQSISGRLSIPVILFPDGVFQVEPTDAELRGEIERQGLLPVQKSGASA